MFKIRVCRRSLLLAPIVAVLLCAATARGLHAEDASSTIAVLVRSFLQAQHVFDLPTITRLTAPSYVEISPLGEVDPRDRMLGFYAPEKKQTAPEMQIDTPEVRLYGDSAVAVTKLAYEVPGPDGAVVKREMRVVFVAHREDGTWKLVSSQYTGIRPKR